MQTTESSQSQLNDLFVETYKQTARYGSMLLAIGTVAFVVSIEMAEKGKRRDIGARITREQGEEAAQLAMDYMLGEETIEDIRKRHLDQAREAAKKENPGFDREA